MLLSQSTLEAGLGTGLLPSSALIFRVVILIFFFLLFFLIVVRERIGLRYLSKIGQLCLISGDQALGGQLSELGGENFLENCQLNA